MERLFNMDNPFFRFMGRVADLMILNILCVVCCIPIVTAGASITAMFYVTLKMVRDEESYIVRGFFKSFKENFKQSTIINLIMLVTAVLLYFDIMVAKSMSGTVGSVLFTIFLIILIVYLMIFLYIYPLTAKFYNTIKNTFINAFLMSIRHLPYTLLMAVVSALPLCIFFISSSQVVSMILLFLVLLGASTIAYVNSLFFVKIFDHYIPKEEEDGETTTEAAASGELPDSGTAAAATEAIGSDAAEAIASEADDSGRAAADVPDSAGSGPAAADVPDSAVSGPAATDVPDSAGPLRSDCAAATEASVTEISTDAPQEDSSL